MKAPVVIDEWICETCPKFYLDEDTGWAKCEVFSGLDVPFDFNPEDFRCTRHEEFLALKQEEAEG